MAPPAKQKAPKGKPAAVGPASTTAADPRFAAFQTDPRYRLPSKKQFKVRLDSRFSRMLDDEDFHKRAHVDRYGRKIKSDKGKKDLQRLYRVGDESSDSDDGGLPVEPGDPAAESGEDDEVVERELQRVSRAQKALKQGYDPARQGGFSSSDSDSGSSNSGDDTETEDDDDVAEAEVDTDEAEAEAFGPRDQAAVPLGEVTKRIAVVNLDWDNIRAVDLLAVASSFKPAEGSIDGVAVYPSEFGRERMQREEVEGPPPEIFGDQHAGDGLEGPNDGDSGDDSDHPPAKKPQPKQAGNGEGAEFDSKALRRYQLDRLRYYYAVIRCSSIQVARALYDNMDGREYLSSANFFDMRFIPDDVSFDDDTPRDQCERVPEGYRPNDFVTDALQHSKVRLTWDEDDRERKDVQKRAFGRSGMDVEENDMLAYIASASSDEGEEGEDDDQDVAVDRFGISATHPQAPTVAKPQGKKDRALALREALGLAGQNTSDPRRSNKDSNPVGNLEVTFTAGLSTKSSGSVFENEPEETTREKYIRKERERKARRKAKATADDSTDPNAVKECAAESNAGSKGTDNGFNDPFFEDPEAANREAIKRERKESKRRLKQERAAADSASAKQRAELELLVADEDASGGKQLRHFDMNEIAKAEKQRKKARKGKKGKADLTEPVAGDANDTVPGFSIDVQDPRFSKVFESHEYAIDPNDPRYKGTEGMKALLEESRRRRTGKRERDEAPGPIPNEPAPKRNKDPKRDGDDLNKLLRKVKSRSAKAS